MTQALIGKHGEQWHEWVLSNLSRQCTPHSLFERMVARVWSQDDAAAAIDEGLAALGRSSDWRVPLPRIRVQGEAQSMVTVLGRLQRPQAVLLDNLLSQQECQALTDYALHKGLTASGVVDWATGQSVSHEARTSSSVFFNRAETPLIGAVEDRLAAVTGWPVSHGEGLQVLRYGPGQEYKPHHDWFDPARSGSATHLRRGGQRVSTTVIYLAAARAGGGTCFPNAGLELTPRTGGAVFFTNLTMDGKPDEMSLHAGTPVIEGTKIVMTYWQREGPFV